MSSIDEDDGKTDFERAKTALIKKSLTMRDQVVALLAKYGGEKLPDLRYKDLAAFARECEALQPPPANAWAIGSAIDDAKGERSKNNTHFGTSFAADGCALAAALKHHGLHIVPIGAAPPVPNPTLAPKFAIGDRVRHTHRHGVHSVLNVVGYELRYILRDVSGRQFPYGVGAEKLELLPSAPPAPPAAPEVPKFKVGQRVETAPEFGPLTGCVSKVIASYSYTLDSSPTKWHQDNLKPFIYI